MFTREKMPHVLAAAFTASSLLAAYAQAATRNWDGDTSATWATAANWDTAPANSLNTDIANFNLGTYDGVTVFAPTVGTATSINGLTIGASNGTMVLTNTAALSIGGSGISIANGAGAFTISGSTTLGASQSWTNNSANLFTFGAVTNAGNTLTVGGSGDTTASGNIGGTGALTKEGAGLLTLNVANTYSGATTVNGGELRWGIVNALLNGALNVNDGGTANIQTFNDSVGTVTIAKGGSITGTTGNLTASSLVSNNGGSISLPTGSLVLSGSLTYNDTISGSSTLSIDRLDIRSGTTFNIARGDDASGVDFDITSHIFSNNNGRSITKSGSGVMRFSGATASGTGGHLADGKLSIQDGTLIFAKSAEVTAFAGSGLFTIGDGIGDANSAVLRYETSSNQIVNNALTINSDGRFDLNGLSETTSGAVINNGSITTGAGTLTLSNNTATALTMGGTGSITGNITMSGNNNATGITATGDTTIAGVLALGTSNNRAIAVTNSDDKLAISAQLTGGTGRTLTKSGAGTLTLSSDNTGFAAAISVTAGTLLVNNTTGSGTGSGGVTVSSTGAIGGTGTIGGATTLNGTLSPGNSPGTLTFAGNLTVNNGASYVFEGGDLAAVGGVLDLNDNWTLSLGSGLVDGGSVTIFTYGTLASAPDLDPTFDITNLGFTPSGTLSLTDAGGSIVLNGVSVVPEPTTLGLLAMGAVGLLRRRRVA